jgi:hypothetical protein
MILLNEMYTFFCLQWSSGSNSWLTIDSCMVVYNGEYLEMLLFKLAMLLIKQIINFIQLNLSSYLMLRFFLKKLINTK